MTRRVRVDGFRTVHRARRLRTGPALLVAVLLLLVTAPAAYAHAMLVSSSPAQGEVVATMPDEVVFTFNQDMSAPAYVIVTAPDGSSVADGDPEVDGSRVTQALTDGPEGTYTMAYRAVSEDGHPVTGQVTFTLGTVGSAGVTPTASAAADPPGTSSGQAGSAAPADGGGAGRRNAILVGVGLMVLAGALLLLSRRSSS